MLIGNNKQQEILANFFNHFENNSIENNFVLLEGPKNIGKSSIVRYLAQKILGDNFKTDYLELKDLSDYLGKKHSIKIEVDSKDMYINIEGQGNYIDLGTRQIIEWLYKSSIANKKILFLENIERMTLSAANSFLKSFEEPLKNRVIIGSTSNRHKILQTILSRAFIIKFDIPNIQETKSFLLNKYGEISSGKLDILMSISQGRIGYIRQIMDKDNSKEDFDKILEHFDKIVNIFNKNGKINQKLNIFKSVYKLGMLDYFLDALVFYCYQNGYYEKIEKIFKTKTLISNNVQWESAVFCLIL